MPRWLVLLNEKAGTIAQATDVDHVAEVSRAMRDAGIDADVQAVPPDQMEPMVRDAIRERFDAVIAGGGDGTINSLATLLLDQPVAFGVLPLGTFNHFAKELGLPTDLSAAATALAHGQPQDLPIGEVNGRIFLNFSGIGLHPRMVSEREKGRDPRKSKMLATFNAALRSLLRLPLMFVRMRVFDRDIRRLTPSVIVCNNSHQMRAFGVEAASVTNRELLNVYVSRATKPLGVIWLFILAMLRLLRPSRAFEVIAAPQVVIHLHRPNVTVSIDGELTRMTAPLTYRVRHKALRVIVPVVAETASVQS